MANQNLSHSSKPRNTWQAPKLIKLDSEDTAGGKNPICAEGQYQTLTGGGCTTLAGPNGTGGPS